MATLDWNSSASGVTALEVYRGDWTLAYGSILISGCRNGGEGEVRDNMALACPNGTLVPIPMPVSTAASACDCPDNDCALMLNFSQ